MKEAWHSLIAEASPLFKSLKGLSQRQHFGNVSSLIKVKREQLQVISQSCDPKIGIQANSLRIEELLNKEETMRRQCSRISWMKSSLKVLCTRGQGVRYILCTLPDLKRPKN